MFVLFAYRPRVWETKSLVEPGLAVVYLWQTYADCEILLKLVGVELVVNSLHHFQIYILLPGKSKGSCAYRGYRITCLGKEL